MAPPAIYLQGEVLSDLNYYITTASMENLENYNSRWMFHDFPTIQHTPVPFWAKNEKSLSG